MTVPVELGSLLSNSLVWQCVPEIQVLRRWRQWCQMSKAISHNAETVRLIWNIRDSV